jgi:hypothetical protein
MMPEHISHFMEQLWYAPHLNKEKLKVNMFVFGLNFIIHEKVRILTLQTFYDDVQKALIVEEELINEVQRWNPVRPVGHVSFGALSH